MKKRVAWWMMSAGFGAVLLFAMAMTLESRWPDASEWGMYLWPGVGMLLGVAGLIWLRKLFHQEPLEPPATWTVTLNDLLMATILAGVCSAIVIEMDRYRRLTPLVGLLVMTLYVHGALAESLRGKFGAWRMPYVVANMGLTLGAVGWVTMGILSVLVIAAGEYGGLPRYWRKVLFRWSGEGWIAVIRVCVYALPVGAVLMAVVNAVAGVGKKETPQQ